MEWGIQLVDPPPRKKGSKKPIIENITGVITLSKLQIGDRIKSVNSKRISFSYNAERAMQLIEQSIEKEGILCLAVGNEEGQDTLIQATVIKPRPEMICEEMGIKVWHWGILCIKKIKKGSFFGHSVLKEGDEIVSVNDIDCWGTKVKPEGFEHIINSLPREVTVVVKRGKQRWSGKFG